MTSTQTTLLNSTPTLGSHDDRGLPELIRESLRELRALTAEERQVAAASTQTPSR